MKKDIVTWPHRANPLGIAVCWEPVELFDGCCARISWSLWPATLVTMIQHGGLPRKFRLGAVGVGLIRMVRSPSLACGLDERLFHTVRSIVDVPSTDGGTVHVRSRPAGGDSFTVQMI